MMKVVSCISCKVVTCNETKADVTLIGGLDDRPNDYPGISEFVASISPEFFLSKSSVTISNSNPVYPKLNDRTWDSEIGHEVSQILIGTIFIKPGPKKVDMKDFKFSPTSSPRLAEFEGSYSM